MPILAPDRNKGKLAGVIMGQLRPTFASRLIAGTESNLAGMNAGEQAEESKEETVQAGGMALRAMFSAMQDGDYEAAFRAFMSADAICDAMEGEAEGY